MERDYVYPEVGDRSAPVDWQEQGGTDVRERARLRVRQLLAERYPEHIDPACDARVRERFNILLSRELVRPDNGRW